MNIFILDYDTKKCAQYHCDKHVVKMILETAQMLCTVGNLYEVDTPYKTTHLNHPCTVWARQSKQNFEWLMSLFEDLHNEWQYRFNHDTNHLSYHKLMEVDFDEIKSNLPDIGLTRFAMAMPEHYKTDDIVESYRNYYINDKADLLQYTNTIKPYWLKDK